MAKKGEYYNAALAERVRGEAIAHLNYMPIGYWLPRISRAIARAFA